MYSKLLLTTLSLVFFSFNSIAGNVNKNKEAKKDTVSIEQQISENIDYPEFVNQTMTTEKIAIKFTVNENFELKIKEVLADNVRLKNYVEKNLNNLKLDIDSKYLNKTYSINLIFD